MWLLQENKTTNPKDKQTKLVWQNKRKLFWSVPATFRHTSWSWDKDGTDAHLQADLSLLQPVQLGGPLPRAMFP